MILLLAEIANDIVPPVNYSLVPPWMIFVASLLVLTIIGLTIWYGRRLFRKGKPIPTPRERALSALNEIEREVERMNPYQFSIRVSDILRRYVMEQFDLPMTRQTSVEFLNAMGSADNHGGLEFMGALFQHVQKPLEVFNNNGGGVGDLKCQRRV